MFPSDWQGWAVFILVTLALSVLGNALWEAAVKPVAARAARATLRTMTLGSSVLLNDIYRRMALRAYYRPTLFLVALCAFATVFAASLHIVWYAEGRGKPPLVTPVEQRERLEGLNPADIEKQRATMEQRLAERERKALQGNIVLLVAACFVFGFAYARMRFELSGGTYFDQCMLVIAPHLSNAESAVLEARFASMRTREECDAIINDIQGIAKKHNITLPTFVLV